MSKIRVSAVSYTNSKPFVYGLEHSGIVEKLDLSLDIPSACATKLIENKADIGLVPVAALLNIPDYHIVSDYCIGAVGAVHSVFIFSNKPIQEVKRLKLDSQSRTSNNLAKVLIQHYWKLNIEFSETAPDAFVEIGDRTFGKTDKYPFVYDLAEHWMNFTGLPFAFAVWASNKPLDPGFVSEFNAALRYGLERRSIVIESLPKLPDFDLKDYLMNKIDFDLTADKRTAINVFLEYVKKL